MSATIEWRVTCRGLEPRYFFGANGRNAASTYARARHHLHPVTWWRENHGRGTGPWIDIADRDPNKGPACDQCGSSIYDHPGNRCPETAA